jgi:hypothetical protein
MVLPPWPLTLSKIISLDYLIMINNKPGIKIAGINVNRYRNYEHKRGKVGKQDKTTVMADKNMGF